MTVETTTGTTNFAPSLGDFVITAYARCGIRRTELLTQHLQDARTETNLIMAKWTASGVNLWSVDLYSIPLVAGAKTYSVPDDTVFLLDVYLTQNGIDRLITPLSRSDYASLANKTMEGTPTSYWFDRQLHPTITLWLVPNDGTTVLKFYRATQLQDASLGSATGVEVPYRFFDAFSWELSWRLASIYAPDRAVALKAVADEAWKNAIQSDTENLGVRIMPNYAGYWR
jgi:hypothetical protein